MAPLRGIMTGRLAGASLDSDSVIRHSETSSLPSGRRQARSVGPPPDKRRTSEFGSYVPPKSARPGCAGAQKDVVAVMDPLARVMLKSKKASDADVSGHGAVAKNDGLYAGDTRNGRAARQSWSCEVYLKPSEEASRQNNQAHFEDNISMDTSPSRNLDSIFLFDMQQPPLRPPLDGLKPVTKALDTVPAWALAADLDAPSRAPAPAEDPDIDAVLQKTEILRSMLADALEDKPVESVEDDVISVQEEDDISPLVSPAAAARTKGGTVEVPMGLLESFEETLTLYEGLCQDLERQRASPGMQALPEAAPLHSDVLNALPEKKRPRGRTSSASSCSGQSTTDDAASACSLETCSLPSSTWSSAPDWYCHSQRSDPPPAALSPSIVSPRLSRAVSPASSAVAPPRSARAQSPYLLQRRLSIGPSRATSTRLSSILPSSSRPTSGSLVVPLPSCRPESVALPVPTGCKKVSYTMTQQQTITITSSVQVTVEVP